MGDGGPATNAVLSGANSVVLDKAGNLYIADSDQGRIRKVGTDGTITTFAGPGSTNGTLGDAGPASSASFGYSSPGGIDLDASGNLICCGQRE